MGRRNTKKISFAKRTLKGQWEKGIIREKDSIRDMWYLLDHGVYLEHRNKNVKKSKKKISPVLSPIVCRKYTLSSTQAKSGHKSY